MDRFDPRQDRTYTLEITYLNGEVEVIENISYQEADWYFATRNPRIVGVDLYSNGGWIEGA